MRRVLGKVTYRLIWKLLELITIVLLARLLLIKDFGIGFLSMTFVYLLTIFFRTGFPRGSTKEIKQYYNTMSVIVPSLGFVLLAILVIVSLFLGPELGEALRLGSVILMLQSFSITPETFYFNREQEERVYTSYIASQIGMSASSISFALLNLGYKSILYGYIIFHLLNIIQLWSRFPFQLRPKLDKRAFRQILKFLKSNLLYSIFMTLSVNGVLIYTAYQFGIVFFSYLFISYIFGFFMYENISIYTNSLIIKKFSDLNIEHLKVYFSKYVEYISLVVVISSVILIIMAPEFIGILIGKSWVSSFIIFSLVVVTGCFRAIFELQRILFIINDKTVVIYRIFNFDFLIFILSMILFVNLVGLTGIALALLLTSLISSVVYSFAAKKIAGVNIIYIAAEYFYIVISGIIVALEIGFIKEIYTITNLTGLLTIMFLGVLTYIAVTFLFNREVYKRFVRFLFELIEE